MDIRPDPETPLAFTRRYTLISLIGVLVTATALAILYRELSIRTIIDFGERSNFAVATTALNAVFPELVEYLQSSESTTAMTADAVPAELLRVIRASVRDSPVERIKIYNRPGIVVYSTQEHEIGVDDSENARFLGAIQGRIRSELSYRDAFNLLDRGTGDDNLIETYVPILVPGSTHPIGVFEVYTDVNPIVRAMTSSELLIFSGIAVIMVILHSLLIYAVRRSERVIASQRQTILERNKTLELLSARTLAAEEAERQRVSLELHEDIAQTLSAVKGKIEALTYVAVQHSVPVGSCPTEDIASLVEQAIRDIRALAMDLRPPALDDFGLVAATRELCAEAELVHGAVRITPDITLREDEVPDALKSIIFRVVQQTLKQVVQTPGIRDVRVVLRDKNGLRLSVEFGAEVRAQPSAALAEQIVPNLWDRAVLAGGSFSSTYTEEGRYLYEVTWVG